MQGPRPTGGSRRFFWRLVVGTCVGFLIRFCLPGIWITFVEQSATRVALLLSGLLIAASFILLLAVPFIKERGRRRISLSMVLGLLGLAILVLTALMLLGRL